MNIYFRRYLYLLCVAFVLLSVIAWWQSRPETVSLSSEWPTPTTKSRLRALGANVTTNKGRTYLDGVEV